MHVGVDENCNCKKKFQQEINVIASDGKGLSQPACPREWKKCEEENEQKYDCDVEMRVCVHMMQRGRVVYWYMGVKLSGQ